MKQPLWIVNSALLFFLIIIIAINVLLQQKPTRIRKREHQEAPQLFKKKKPAIKKETIYKYDIFDTFQQKEHEPKERSLVTPVPEPKIPEPPKPPAQKKAVLQSPLNVTLKGIILAADEKKSIAMLADETGKEKNYYPGDQIKDAQVMKVAQNRVVIIRSNGQHETFRLRKEEENLTGTGDDDDKEDPLSLVVKKIKENKYKLDPKRFAKEVSTLGNIIENHAIITAYQNGDSIGVRIDNMPEKSILHAMGIQKGDIIKSIDNTPASGRKNRMKIYDRITSSSNGETIGLKITRGSDEIQLDYTLTTIEKPIQHHFLPEDQQAKQNGKDSDKLSKLDSLDSRDRQLRDFSQRHSTKQQDMMGEIRKRILDNMNARPQSARMRKN